MWTLKQISKELGGTLKSQNLFHPNLEEISIRIIEIADYKNFKIRINEFQSQYEIFISINSPFIFSINNFDKILPINKLVVVDLFPYKVFVSNKNPFLNESFLEFWRAFVPILIEFKLSKDETIVFYQNKISLVISQQRSIGQFLSIFLTLLDSRSKIFNASSNKVRIFARNIPKKLRILKPILVKWALSDGIERQQLIEKTSKIQKTKLIKIVNPLMNDINGFLDSFNDKVMSEEAIQIGKLAEFISELIVEGNGKTTK
ncbi:hypothetical protein SAMN04487898_107124 [Pedobacter sp. ok626]|uniref:hypothetical protein n=1 Tax=Pedobacter sp. ok626 TaxID=1761882 RepID=UPI00088EA167|nr:hypothetical protein [Pedobacter sp. ok626]SDK29362.1 hypothetical protein SAMN04487898_107124 [Pedobacter sp. ok626]